MRFKALGRKIAIKMAARVKRIARKIKTEEWARAFLTTTNVTPQMREQNISARSALSRRSIVRESYDVVGEELRHSTSERKIGIDAEKARSNESGGAPLRCKSDMVGIVVGGSSCLVWCWFFFWHFRGLLWSCYSFSLIICSGPITAFSCWCWDSYSCP